MAWQLPASLSILGKRYAVIARRKDGSRAFGSTDVMLSEIEIAEHLSQDEAAETLLHEVIHAVCYAFCVELEEDDLSRLSAGLYAALVANPGLLDVMQGETGEEPSG